MKSIAEHKSKLSGLFQIQSSIFLLLVDRCNGQNIGCVKETTVVLQFWTNTHRNEYTGVAPSRPDISEIAKNLQWTRPVFSIIARFTERHTPRNLNNKDLKFSRGDGKKNWGVRVIPAEQHLLSFVGRVFFSFVSACFNFVLSNLVTSSKSGLSDIFKGATNERENYVTRLCNLESKTTIEHGKMSNFATFKNNSSCYL